MAALTKRQREVLDFIAEFIRVRRYSPSLEEIAAHFGLKAVATVHKHVSCLERKGFIKRAWNRSRSIEIVALGGLSEEATVRLATTAAYSLALSELWTVSDRCGQACCKAKLAEVERRIRELRGLVQQ